MKQWLGILLAVALLCACSRLPQIITDPGTAASAFQPACRMPFPRGTWQLQHAIDATVRGRTMGRLIGVMILSAPGRSIQCALMTIEGLVLFSARYDGRLTVERAVDPFDQPGFADGLIDDLTLIFLAPETAGRFGRTADGDLICRYPHADHQITDIVVRDPDHWIINRYNDQGRLLRRVSAEREDTAGDAGRSGIARHITLQSRSGSDYRLELTLIEAVPIQPD